MCGEWEKVRKLYRSECVGLCLKNEKKIGLPGTRIKSVGLLIFRWKCCIHCFQAISTKRNEKLFRATKQQQQQEKTDSMNTNRVMTACNLSLLLSLSLCVIPDINVNYCAKTIHSHTNQPTRRRKQKIIVEIEGARKRNMVQAVLISWAIIIIILFKHKQVNYIENCSIESSTIFSASLYTRTTTTTIIVIIYIFIQLRHFVRDVFEW